MFVAYEMCYGNSSSIVERLREGRERAEQLDESIADLMLRCLIACFSKDIALHIDSVILTRSCATL